MAPSRGVQDFPLSPPEQDLSVLSAEALGILGTLISPT